MCGRPRAGAVAAHHGGRLLPALVGCSATSWVSAPPTCWDGSGPGRQIGLGGVAWHVRAGPSGSRHLPAGSAYGGLVGSKSARHAHREKTRKRRRKPSGSSADTHTFGTFSAAGERLAAYRGCETFEEAAAVARSRLDESLDELVRLVEPYDPWDVLDLLQVRCTPPPPAAGQQPDPEANAALVDLVAVIVRPRGLRDTARPAGAAGGRPQASPVIEEVHRLALDCLRTGADAIAFGAAAEHKGALARIRAGAVLREMTLRNAVYPHMLRDTLRALFAHPDVTADCQAALGFTV